MPTPQEIREAMDAGLAKAAEAMSYRLPDGTEVKRAAPSELMAVRDQVRREEAQAKRKSKFVPLALTQGS